MDKIKELFVVLNDEPKATADLCRIFKKKRISIYAIGIFQDTARFYVSHPDKAMEALQLNNYEVEERDVLRIILPNKQGALMEFTAKLGNAGINIEYLYGAMMEKQKKGTIILEVDDPDLALGLFKNHKF